MKLLRKMTAFILAFSLLAGTVAVLSASAHADDAAPSLKDEVIADPILPEFERNSGKTALADTAAQTYTPRLTAPSYDNKYYYSDLNVFYQYGWGMPNCTCYAWGRAYEILGTRPNLSVYSAYLWYDYNRDNNIYTYGTTPKLGAIACWVYSSGTSGHVAVVEKIENNTITFSNSAYSTGVEFYTSTAPVNDPSNGNKTWIFQGYIYLGDFISDTPYESVEDPATPANITGDVYRITDLDGVNLRSGAGTGYEILGSIAYGQDVTVTKTKLSGGYTWGYTTYHGVTGWFVTDFARLIYRKTDETTPDPEPATEPPTEKPTSPSIIGPILRPTVDPGTEPATEAPTRPSSLLPDDDPNGGSSRMLVMGDVDGDDDITILDATRLQLILAELYVPTEYMITVGDFDGDSELTIMDALGICYFIAFSD